MMNDLYPCPDWRGNVGKRMAEEGWTDEAPDRLPPPSETEESEDDAAAGIIVFVSLAVAFPIAIVFALGCWWQGWNPFFGFLGSLFGTHICLAWVVWVTRPRPSVVHMKEEGFPEV
jgi:hypothetical protein